MHARHLLVNNRKMAKREGTAYTLEDLQQLGYSPLELRYLLLSHHYRQPMNFTFDGLDAARASIARLQTCRNLLAEAKQATGSDAAGAGTQVAPAVAECVAKLEQDFGQALDDDLNVANALAALFEFVATVNRTQPVGASAAAALDALDRADHVLAVLSTAPTSGLITKQELDQAVSSALNPEQVQALLGWPQLDATSVRKLVAARHAARKSKDFAAADAIRDGLKALGVALEDTAQGVRYKLK